MSDLSFELISYHLWLMHSYNVPSFFFWNKTGPHKVGQMNLVANNLFSCFFNLTSFARAIRYAFFARGFTPVEVQSRGRCPYEGVMSLEVFFGMMLA